MLMCRCYMYVLIIIRLSSFMSHSCAYREINTASNTKRLKLLSRVDRNVDRFVRVQRRSFIFLQCSFFSKHPLSTTLHAPVAFVRNRNAIFYKLYNVSSMIISSIINITKCVALITPRP